jgi:hypothetical protein
MVHGKKERKRRIKIRTRIAIAKQYQASLHPIILVPRTNFAAVAMEIKKGGIFKKKMISFIKLHETSYQYSP